MTLEQFKENVAKDLKEDKLKEAVLAEQGDSADADKDSKADSKKSSKKSSEDEESADDKKFDEYIDGLIASFDVKINDAPAELSYDPQVVAKNAQSESSEEGEASESSDDSSK